MGIQLDCQLDCVNATASSAAHDSTGSAPLADVMLPKQCASREGALSLCPCSGCESWWVLANCPGSRRHMLRRWVGNRVGRRCACWVGSRVGTRVGRSDEDRLDDGTPKVDDVPLEGVAPLARCHSGWQWGRHSVEQSSRGRCKPGGGCRSTGASSNCANKRLAPELPSWLPPSQPWGLPSEHQARLPTRLRQRDCHLNRS